MPLADADSGGLTILQTERIRRIIDATQTLLGEIGAEKMTMRDVAAASQVAEGTLYNRFGSKDNLISTAIVDTFERSVQAPVRRHRAPTPLQQILYEIGVIVRAILQAKPFARGLMRTYFRVDDPLDMSARLTQSVYDSWLPTIQAMQQQNLLRPWVRIPLLCREIGDRLFGVVLKWAQGSIADSQLRERVSLSILMALLGASRGEQAREIEKRLERLSRRLDHPNDDR